MIRSFPLYYKTISLNYDSRPKFSNKFDIFLSILSLIFLISITIFYFFQMTNKEPYIFYQGRKIENKANFTFTRLPFFIGLIDIQSHQFIKNFAEYIIPFLSYNNRKQYEKILIRPCNKSELLEFQEIVNGKKENNSNNIYNDIFNYNNNNSNNENQDYALLCPDLQNKEYILKGTQNVLRTDGFVFTFQFIKNRNYTIDYERLELLFVWPDLYLDSLDYDNPIKKVGKSELFFFMNERLEHYNIYFDQNNFTTNKGYFSHIINSTNYLSLNSISHFSITNRIIDETTHYLSLITIDIYLTPTVNINIITYRKFSDILTKIVSFFSILHKIFSILSSSFRNKSMIIRLINHFENNENIKKINKEFDNDFKDSIEEYLEVKQKQFKLRFYEYLLPNCLLKKDKHFLLYQKYQNLFNKILNVENIIRTYLENNSQYTPYPHYNINNSELIDHDSGNSVDERLITDNNRN